MTKRALLKINSYASRAKRSPSPNESAHYRGHKVKGELEN